MNQFRRIFVDDGRDDKDFTVQEERLREAHRFLTDAAKGLTKAADLLSDVIRSQNS